MRLGLSQCLSIGITHIDRDRPANQLRHDDAVQAFMRLTHITEDPLTALRVAEGLEVGVLVSSRPLDRFATAL